MPPALLVAGCGTQALVNVSAQADLTPSVPLNMSLITKYGRRIEYDDGDDDVPVPQCLTTYCL